LAKLFFEKKVFLARSRSSFEKAEKSNFSPEAEAVLTFLPTKNTLCKILYIPK